MPLTPDNIISNPGDPNANVYASLDQANNLLSPAGPWASASVNLQADALARSRVALDAVVTWRVPIPVGATEYPRSMAYPAALLAEEIVADRFPLKDNPNIAEKQLGSLRTVYRERPVDPLPQKVINAIGKHGVIHRSGAGSCRPCLWILIMSAELFSSFATDPDFAGAFRSCTYTSRPTSHDPVSGHPAGSVSHDVLVQLSREGETIVDSRAMREAELAMPKPEWTMQTGAEWTMAGDNWKVTSVTHDPSGITTVVVRRPA